MHERERSIAEFKTACTMYLNTRGLTALRAYGMYINMRAPTKLKKADLIKEIIGILCGEIVSCRVSQGAPVKNDHPEQKDIDEIERLQKLYLDGDIIPIKKARDRTDTIADDILSGQITFEKNTAYILPLNGQIVAEEAIISKEFVELYDLREGDIVNCKCEYKDGKITVTNILTINNGVYNKSFQRGYFDAFDISYPQENISFETPENSPSILIKSVDWLFPLKKGERGVIHTVSQRDGTEILFELAKVADIQSDLRIFVLLLDKPPEVVKRFKSNLSKNTLVYTTYGDDAEKQRCAAEFLLKRAKRYAESGCNVLLLVDSLNTLGRAYNGDISGQRYLFDRLDGRAIYSIKGFLGSARCLQESGSLTILGTLSGNTGNPIDDVIAAELSEVFNYEIYLDKDYPTIDYVRSCEKAGSKEIGLFGKQNDICKLLEQAKTKEEFFEMLTKKKAENSKREE